MFRLVTVFLLAAILTGGCAASTPAPELPAAVEPESTSTPTPAVAPTTDAPTPTATPITNPESILVIKDSNDPMKSPYGVAINSKGKIYVNDAGNNRVLIFDGAGALLAKWDAQGGGDGQFSSLGFGGMAPAGRKSNRPRCQWMIVLSRVA